MQQFKDAFVALLIKVFVFQIRLRQQCDRLSKAGQGRRIRS
jgi:hypothetical protein